MSGSRAKNFDVFKENLAPGDLIYGFREARAELIDFLVKNNQIDANEEAHPFPVTIDSYNKYARVQGNILYNPKWAFNRENFLNSFKTKINPDGTPLNPRRLQSKEFHEFAATFEGEQHTDPYYYQETMGGVMGEYAPEKVLDPFIKKRCKLGILWALKKGFKIHFLLDGIKDEPCITRKDSRYTYAELRFLFRYWEFLEPFHEAGLINFYKNEQGVVSKVSPPWGKFSEETYKEYQKLYGKNQLPHRKEEWRSQKIKEYINFFHLNPPIAKVSDQPNSSKLVIITRDPLPTDQDEKNNRAENREANWENPYLTPAICKIALQEDIIKYKDRLDSANPLCNALIQAIEKAQKSDDFMASIPNSCEHIALDFIHISANNNDYRLCLALADSKKLLQKWPHISTFEGLVCAAQKLEAINQIQMSLLSSPHKENAKDLIDQINNSDVSTTIYDILRPGSLFLEVKSYDKIFKGELESLARYYKYLDPKIIVGDLTKESYKTKRRSHLENLNIHAELIKARHDYIHQGYKTYGDEVDSAVKGVTQTLTEGEELNTNYLSEKMQKIAAAYGTEEMTWAKMNTELAHALRDLKIDYKARDRRYHRDEIDALIQNVVASFDKNNNLSHKQRFSRIISEIQRAYDIEKSNYINKFIIFERTPESFEARLKENDNRYCYPRGLKAILDNFKPYQDILKLEAQKEELPQMKKGKSK